MGVHNHSREHIYGEKKQTKTKCILVPFIFMTVEWGPL